MVAGRLAVVDGNEAISNMALTLPPMLSVQSQEQVESLTSTCLTVASHETNLGKATSHRQNASHTERERMAGEYGESSPGRGTE
jgi:hypothetical protein